MSNLTGASAPTTRALADLKAVLELGTGGVPSQIAGWTWQLVLWVLPHANAACHAGIADDSGSGPGDGEPPWEDSV